MNSAQLEEAKARAYNVKTPPGKISEPAWKVGPSRVVVDAQEREGGEVPPGCDITWMGAQHPETHLE